MIADLGIDTLFSRPHIIKQRIMYLHKELETLSREGIEKLQLERLQHTVRHCMNSAFYKKRF